MTERRKRFERSQAAHSLTPLKVRALTLVAESRFLSTPQVAGLMGLSDHAARGHLRDLYDMGLTDVVAVPGVSVGSTALLSAKIHHPTRKGIEELEALGTLPASAKSQGYSPTQFAFLAHELAVRDTLVWLTRLARAHDGHAVERWDCSGSLQQGAVRPDAVFVYRYGETFMAGVLETDMGTERGNSGDRLDRWAQKAQGYAALFASETGLRALTGAPRARLVVTVSSESRAQWVAARLAPVAKHAWIGVRGHEETWTRGDGTRRPFLKTEKGREE